jgi:LVIVD repeat
MRKLVSLLAAGLVALSASGAASTSATAGPSLGGLTSDNVEWVDYIPFDFGTASGAKIIGKHMYVTSWRNFSIYDISNPLEPELVKTVPFGFKFENEDVDGNNKIMIFSEELPQPSLHVWDVEDKTNPVEIAVLPGAGQHTMSCLQNCKWLYGSDGFIIDLRNPNKPKKLPNKWSDGLVVGSPHDVNEVGKNRVLTSSDPLLLLNTKNPAKPKLVAQSTPMGEFIHSSKWPQNGKDRFALSTGETWIPGATARCTDSSGGFATWDSKGYKKTKTLRMVDVFRPKSGTYVDGSPPSGTTFGCSTHWFEHHPKFRNGGTVAVTFFNHGTHFMKVSKKGKISDMGWFVPHAGNSAAVEWLTDRLVYAIDLQKGFDILKWKGPIK